MPGRAGCQGGRDASEGGMPMKVEGCQGGRDAGKGRGMGRGGAGWDAEEGGVPVKVEGCQ